MNGSKINYSHILNTQYITAYNYSSADVFSNNNTADN